jgi:predicted RND superfamily exporter protein
VVALVSVGGWVGLTQLPVEANPEQLAKGLPAVQDAQHAQSILGSSGEVQVVLRGKNVLTPEAFAWLRQAEDTTVLNHGDQLRPIISLPGLLEFLGPSPNQEQIAAGVGQLPSYITGSVVRGDSHEAVISLGLELQDLSSQRQLLNSLHSELPKPPAGFDAEVTGLPVAAARGYALVSSERYLPSLVGILAAGLVLLIGLSRRSDAMRAVLAAVLATGWGLAGVWVLSVPLTPLTAALGSLTTATACEFTVLLSRAYETGRPSRRTVRVVALAAAIGYLALTVSGLAMIREFGIVLACTVGLSYIAAHVVVRLFPTRTDRPAQSTDIRKTTVRTEVPV